LIELKDRRLKRIVLQCTAVAVAFGAWLWLAGLRYANRIGEFEATCAAQLAEAERALESADLAKAEALLVQSEATEFSRGSALRKVEDLHATGAMAWLPQPVLVAELGLYGFKPQDLVARAKGLRLSLEERRNAFGAAVDQVHAHLAAERFVDAQVAIDALPSISKDQPETLALRDLFDRLRRISTELAQLDNEINQRMAAADLSGALRLHDEYEDGLQIGRTVDAKAICPRRRARRDAAGLARSPCGVRARGIRP
jgi:hypothetical protein